jgi:hypothetical protein
MLRINYREYIITHCHPEQREGSWCLRVEAALVPRAQTKIPRVARDDS